MTNSRLARAVLSLAARAGVREIVLCAGARNAPLVVALSSARGVRVHSFFEERSAAFFALGRILSAGAPVAVVTTSGTAVAELLPAVIEADHQGLPLLVISADRPRRYRGSGAPQTIVQPGLFSHYVEREWDVEGEAPGSLSWSRRRPAHLNLCFDEPLIDELNEPWLWPRETDPLSPSGSALAEPPELRFRRPLIIAGGLPASAAPRVGEVLQAWNRPVYLEGPSQLRGRLPELEILEESVARLDFDGVIRIGGVPTLRFWRDLENSDVPVLHFSDLPFSGLPRSREVRPLAALPAHAEFEPWLKTEFERTRERRLAALLEEFALSEPGWIGWLSGKLPPSARLFLGNSLPVREWDLAAARRPGPRIFANRGVNGIDGLISTFAGVCEAGASNWAVLGDLSSLYDLSGPWALRSRPELLDVTLVIVNNGGGRIFKRIFQQPLFENEHELRFAHWSAMWNLEHHCLERPVELGPAARPRVIEILPDAAQTEAFWRAWEAK